MLVGWHSVFVALYLPAVFELWENCLCSTLYDVDPIPRTVRKYVFVSMLNLFKRVFNDTFLIIEINVNFLNPFNTITH